MYHKPISFWASIFSIRLIVYSQSVWVQLIWPIFILGLFGYSLFIFFLIAKILWSLLIVLAQKNILWRTHGACSFFRPTAFWILAIIVKAALIWANIGPQREGGWFCKMGLRNFCPKEEKWEIQIWMAIGWDRVR